jgi:hypothetical protein
LGPLEETYQHFRRIAGEGLGGHPVAIVESVFRSTQLCAI